MIVQPTKATIAARSSTEPEALRESVAQDPLERRDEDWLTLRIPGHEGVGLPGVEQEQDDARADDDLDQPEHEDDDAPGQLGAPRARPGDAAAVRSARSSRPAGVAGAWVTTVRSI